MNYNRSCFAIESSETQYKGFTCGNTWNGWACPCFEKAVAEQIFKDLCEDEQWHYSARLDMFCYAEDSDQELDEEWPSLTINVNGITHKVYAIGAQSWMWDEVNEDDNMSVYECPNCYSDMTVRQCTISGTIRKPSLFTSIELIDYEIENVLFSECEECGHRWTPSEIESPSEIEFPQQATLLLRDPTHVCSNCMYCSVSYSDLPCSICNYFDKWEVLVND
jgi:hypothetical protein